MTEKVKLPRKIAEAIETVWKKEEGIVIHKHIKLNDWSYLWNYHLKEHEILLTYADEYPLEYMTALVNGYEVEQTPEDKVREQYNTPRHFVNKGEDTDVDIYRKGIKFALDTLGIKIEGVNA